MTFVTTGDAVMKGRYSAKITSRERMATSTGVLSTWQVTYVGGATLTLKDSMSSGGSVSLPLVDRMNDTSDRTGLGIAVCSNECNIISEKSYHP